MNIQTTNECTTKPDDGVQNQNIEVLHTSNGQLLYFVRVKPKEVDKSLQTGQEISTLNIYADEPVTDASEANLIILTSESDSSATYDINRAKKRGTDPISKTNKKMCSEIPTVTLNGHAEEIHIKEASLEVSQENKMSQTIRNLSEEYQPQISHVLTTENGKEKETGDASNVLYRVVYPEELDLKPLVAKPQKKGRPRKKNNVLFGEENPSLMVQAALSVKNVATADVQPSNKTGSVVKNVRTRSGRITRPPTHIKKDFKKIDTSESSNNNLDLKTVEFEPLKTNQKPTTKDVPVKTDQLENHIRKRSIAAQYRCPTCQKAYLGHSKMLKHLEQFPDHGPIPERCKAENDDTWNFLIDISRKSSVGQRGIKFCKELITLFRNVRFLAKLFFKRPNGTDKNLYFVDNDLSALLGIKSGNYILNENELHRKVHITSCFEEIFHKSGTEVSNTKSEPSDDASSESNTQNFKNNLVKNNDNALNSKENTNTLQYSLSNGNSGSLEYNVNSVIDTKPPCNLEVLNFDTMQVENHSEFNLNCNTTATKIANLTFDQQLQMINQFNSETVSKNDKETPTGNLNSVNHSNDIKTLNSDLSLHSELLSENSLLNALPNLRTSSDDELILSNVDSTHVTNLLDNSMGSDEVMNVDQFVNERFKNLTQSELELPNTPLHLDLPGLDLFQFNTS